MPIIKHPNNYMTD